ncbi:MAG: polyisoprenyl-phosphate glycosyltransferase [Thermoleophilaceae bacterium]|nr:polyisoprenyl-phosphate glycosyltransferase [Thermoleophilaceae bacterium]
METPRYSFVVPIYNEEATLWELSSRLTAVFDRLGGPVEAVLVDDGSTDASFELLSALNESDPRFKVIRFARNFGHQLAITAGIDHASGDAVIVMDGDLQDPPEVALDLIERWKEGYEVVYAVREERAGDPWLKRVTARVFYRTLRRMTDVDIPADVGDFRLVDRRAADQFRALRENNRYVRGMFSWIGFRQTGVAFKRDERYAGTTKYPWRRSMKLAADGVVSFSNVPLRAALGLGFFVSGASFLLGIAAIVAKLLGIAEVVPGWASIVVGMSFLGGVQLIVIGMMGLYVARIYEEVRRRPLYIARDSIGFDAESVSGPPLVGASSERDG